MVGVKGAVRHWEAGEARRAARRPIGYDSKASNVEKPGTEEKRRVNEGASNVSRKQALSHSVRSRVVEGVRWKSSRGEGNGKRKERG